MSEETGQGQTKMAENAKDKNVDLGVFAKNQPRQAVTAADVIAAALSLLWLVGSIGFFVVVGQQEDQLAFDPMVFVMTLLAIAMPVAVIWIGASAAKSARIMREESARLQASIDAMRHSYIEQQQRGVMSVRPSVEKKLDEIVASQKQAETTIATFASTRSAQASAPRPAPVPTENADADQQTLALGTPAEDLQPPLSTQDFLLAMNFPETTEDRDGFRALRLALQDRKASKLIRSAQDILTLLSQDGIYMDDLSPDRARPEVWRRFANGERGPTVAALGGVRDRSCLALTAGRMRQDPVFRDSVHHFLRQFDKTLSAFEPEATDQQLSDLSDTRTARAFMLLGRVSGTFD